MVKRLIWDIREREYEYSGQKTQYILNLEHGIHLSVPKVYEILTEKYIIRSKWKKNKASGKVPQAERPREVIQMDTVNFGELYALTAIDIFMVPNLTAKSGYQFLSRTMIRRFDGHLVLANFVYVH